MNRFRFALIVAAAMVMTGSVFGDTIILMNGRSFYGKVTEHLESIKDKDGNFKGDARLYRVYFGSTDRHSDDYKGYIDILKKDVKEVEINDLDAFKDHNFDLE